jgi:hypothetical protein
MDVYRTPAERFDGLPDWAFEPRHLDLGGLEMHYVDEGSGALCCCYTGSRHGRSSIAR